MNEFQIKQITYQNFWNNSKINKNISQNSNFGQILKEKITEQNLKFSKHAIDRIKERKIELTADDVDKINEAVKKAETKGIKDTLIFMNNTAYIVNIKNRTIITAVNGEGLKENVFTNIDGVIFI